MHAAVGWVIIGTVQAGCGRAAPAFRPARMRELVRLFGWLPYPGTLNVHIADLRAAVAALGEPDALTEHDTPIGPLRWWRAEIGVGDFACPGLVVRGARTKTRHLEIVAPVRLRDAGAVDGVAVRVKRL